MQSQYARAVGKTEPLFAYGKVLWLTPGEWAHFGQQIAEQGGRRATQEEIDFQDVWEQEIEEQDARDMQELARAFLGRTP